MQLFRLYGSILVKDKEALDALNKTKKEVQNVAKAMDKLGGMAKNAGKVIAIGIGAGTAAISAVVMKTADKLGAIDDAAQRVGMSAEEFQKFAYAAKQSGIEVGQLEGAMIKNQRAFTDAKEGSKAMGEAYSRLGIDITKVGSSSEAFDLVVARLADMKDETERNAIANDIFGKSYADLTPLLNQGSDGIIALKDEAVALGGVMSNEAVTAGAEFGDQMERLKTSFEGVFSELGIKFMPMLDSFMTWVLDNMPTIQGIVDTVLTAIGDSIQWISDNINWILPLLAGMLGAFVAFKVVSTILTIFGLFKTLIAGSTTVMAIFNRVMAANPAILIALAIGVLIAAIVFLFMNWKKVSKFLGDSAKWVGNMFIGMVNMVIEALNNMIAGFLSPFNLLIKGFNATVGKITGKIPEIKVSIPKIPKMAMGGLVYGDSLVNVGEYPGARSNPEVITPLDKLKGMLDLNNNSIDENMLERAFKKAMNGMSVVLDDRQVGAFVDTRLIKGVL